MNPIKVIIIDDNKGIRSLIKEILEFEADMQFCAEAENLTQAREILLQWQPDVAILDISMDENEGGLKFLKEVAGIDLPTRFIVLSAHNEHTYGEQSLQAGAKGYICKDKAVQCLAQAVRDVHAGKEYMSSANNIP